MQDVDRPSAIASVPPAASALAVPSSDSVDTTSFDLIAYARGRRYRVRNLHDGHPVPPARRTKHDDPPSPVPIAYTGKADRWDAIVGYVGFVTDEGDSQLGICLFYRSSKGGRNAEARIRALGGQITQIGDVEIAGTIPVERVEDALKLIRVSKLHPGNPNPTIPPGFYDAHGT